MKHFSLIIAIVLIVALTILSGVLQGNMRNRWGPSADVLSAANKLPEIPTEFAGWRLQSTDELDEDAARQLECHAYIIRNYENQATGDVVSVTLLLGPPGPISVHTPEVCFGSRNFKRLSERQLTVISRADGRDDEFWTLDFKANNLRGDLLRVCYAWTSGDRWTATNDPRFTYAGQPYLYKIQLSSRLPPGAVTEAQDPCRQFLSDFLPVARKYLIEPSLD